jgi:hypothetical protein
MKLPVEISRLKVGMVRCSVRNRVQRHAARPQGPVCSAGSGPFHFVNNFFLHYPGEPS